MTLAERPGAATIGNILIDDYGIDMSHNARTHINSEPVDAYDRVVVMAEIETIPEWLVAYWQVRYWKVDNSKGQAVPTTRRVELLVAELKNID